MVKVREDRSNPMPGITTPSRMPRGTPHGTPREALLGAPEWHAARAIASSLAPTLAAITTAAELAATSSAQPLPTTRHALRRIAASAALAERLVDDLQDLAEAEGDQLRLDRRRTELGGMIRGLISSGLARDDRDRVALDLRDSPVAFVDRRRIERVLTTLIEYALHHALGVVVVRVDREHDHANISVTDRSVGLTAEQVQSMFAPCPKHFGVPLYVSRKIVEAHGGRVSVASSIGAGTRFVVVLPTLRT